MPAVTVRTIPNIMQPRGRETWHEAPGFPMLSYCPESFDDGSHLYIIHNGQAVTRDNARDVHLRDGDEVIFAKGPRLGALAVSIVVSLIITGITYGIQSLTAPSTRPTKKDLEDSETYGIFDGIVNTVRPGTRIPIIYGEHRTGGQIIQQFLRAQLVQSASGLTQDPKGGQITSLIGVCTGPIESMSNFRIDSTPVDSPLTSARPVIRVRLGQNHQSAINGFQEIVTQVTKDVPVTGPVGPFTTTTQSEVDAFEVVIRFPGGLFRTSDRGAFLQKECQIRIEYRETGTDIWTVDFIRPSEATRNPFDVSYRASNLGRAKYDIRVTRLTPDDTTATGFSDFSVFAILEILDDSQTYPRLAYYSVEQLPTAQFSGTTPTYDVLVQGKLVNVYFSENAFAKRYSNNPAWCLLDFLANPFDGLGPFIGIDRIDIPSFIELADFCDEEELTLNIVLDGSLSAFDTIRQMCTAARCFFLLRGDKWAVKPDREEEPVQFFSMGRIGKDTFAVTRQSRANKANYLIGEFWNAELDYAQDSLPKEDPTLAIGEDQIEATINLLGVTNSKQANKILNYTILSNRLNLRSIEFEAGIEALAMEAGDVFAVSHDVPQWGFSGKIRDIDETGTSIQLDRDVTIEDLKEYELTVFHDKTETLDIVRVVPIVGTSDRITVAGGWTTMPTKGMDYAFGDLTKSFQKYRCVGITRGTAVARRKIKAVEYNPEIYGEDLTVLPPPSGSLLPDPFRIPADVKDLRLAERTVYAEDGTLSTAIDVFFTLPVVAGVRAEIFWREKGLLTFESVGTVTSGFGTITQNVRSPGATYEVAVCSLSLFGARNDPEIAPRAEITTVGVTRQPDNVSAFRADRTLEGLVFSWQAVDPVRNFDLSNYEIRTGASWDTGITIGEPIETTFRTSAFVKGENTYFIKAKNTAGKFSPIAQSVTLEVDPRINENVKITQQEDPTFPGTKEAFTVVSSKLQMQTESQVMAWRALMASSSFGGSRYIPGGMQPGFRVTGSYTTAKFQVTTGNAVRALVSSDIVAIQVDLSAYWSNPALAGQAWTSEYAKTRSWTVAPDGKVKVAMEMRFSTNTNADADFGPWQERAQNIEVSVKWAQARILVEIVDPAFTVEIEKLRIIFDVPDERDSGSVTTSSSSTVTANFNKTFNNAPKVVATIQSASAGDDIVRAAPTTAGFDISVFNGGVRVVRTVEWVAVGF